MGPAPEVLEALANTPPTLDRYPDPNARILKETISQWKGLNPEQVLCGNGSEELIYLLPQAFLEPGDEVVTNQIAFSAYEKATLNRGGKIVRVPNLDFCTDPKNLLGAVTPRTKILFLDNPGNPTSTYMGRADFEYLYTHLPPHVLLVLDEAYYEYVTDPDKFSGLDYVNERQNLLVLRTFSKFYGLAGIRCGWCCGPSEIIQKLSARQPPLSMNSLAQTLIPVATQPLDHYERVKQRNETWRTQLSTFFQNQGISVPPSQTNFITPQFSHAEACEAYRLTCESKGVQLYSLVDQNLPHHLRISLGSDQALEQVRMILPRS